MRVGVVYEICLGSNKDKYLCVSAPIIGIDGLTRLRRVRLPKSKIDSLRLPENISIMEFSTPLKSPTTKPKQK